MSAHYVFPYLKYVLLYRQTQSLRHTSTEYNKIWMHSDSSISFSMSHDRVEMLCDILLHLYVSHCVTMREINTTDKVYNISKSNHNSNKLKWSKEINFENILNAHNVTIENTTYILSVCFVFVELQHKVCIHNRLLNIILVDPNWIEEK